jgi:nucleoside-diphosphate-sugar epimerase
VKLLVTGATGYLGWRSTVLLRERGHEVVALARPGHRPRAASAALEPVEADAGAPSARDLVAGCDAVLHFAGVPDPAGARADPARAVRENAGTTLNLLEACAEHGAGLVYPSSTRAATAPDPYGISKRLGEEACRLHAARATSVRMTSIFGPGQNAWEGATGAIAAFAARALDGRPIAIPGNPRRTRDFLYVDDFVDGLERHVAAGAWPDLVHAGSGVATPLEDAARLTVAAAGSDVEIGLPGGQLPPGEDDSYALDPQAPRLALAPRPLPDAVAAYVDWLRRFAHPAAQGSARA